MDGQLLSDLRDASEVSGIITSRQSEINKYNAQMAKLKKQKITSKTFTIIAVCSGWLIGFLVNSVIVAITNNGSLIPTLIVYSLIIGLGIFLDYVKVKNDKITHSNKIAALQNQIDFKNQELSTYIDNHLETISKVPSQYFYPIAIDYFMEVLSNGRADTFKEAMNLFEEQLHRWKLEDMAKTSMIAQQQTAANSAAIRTTSAISAAASVANLMRK